MGEDKIEIIIQDDLSGIESITATWKHDEEDIEPRGVTIKDCFCARKYAGCSKYISKFGGSHGKTK